jgi:RimJ/RimL family protein N-acetyltransferase
MQIPIRQLESKRLILRLFRSSDVEAFFSYRCDPGIAKYQLWEPFTRDQALDFVHKYKSAKAFVPGEWFGFAIELKETGQLIGDLALKVESKDYAQAEVGFNLAPKFQKQGFASEAVFCILDYLFTELSLHRVYAIIDSQNKAAEAVLKKVDMRKEGHFVQNIRVKGNWGDEYFYAILKQEWTAKKDCTAD